MAFASTAIFVPRTPTSYVLASDSMQMTLKDPKRVPVAPETTNIEFSAPQFSALESDQAVKISCGNSGCLKISDAFAGLRTTMLQ